MVGIYSDTFKSVIFENEKIKSVRMIPIDISKNIWKCHSWKCQNQKCKSRCPLPLKKLVYLHDEPYFFLTRLYLSDATTGKAGVPLSFDLLSELRNFMVLLLLSTYETKTSMVLENCAKN